MKQTPPPVVFGCIIDAGQEPIVEILDAQEESP